MIKNIYIAFLLISTMAFSQTKNIEFHVEKENKTLAIYGSNNTDEPLDITLTINNIKMLKGYSQPITKRVEPKSKTQFIKMTFDYEMYSYNLSYTYNKIESEDQEKPKAYNKEDYYLNDLSKINEGIVIFDDTGCGNCRLVTNYLVGHEIDFKIIDLSASKDNSKLMWKTIKEKGASLKVKLPVIIVDGKLTHSHKDIKAFLEALK